MEFGPWVITVGEVTTLILFQLALGFVALLVVGAVAALYRGRQIAAADRLPGAPLAKLTSGVAAVFDKVDPGEAPPQGVLTSPAKSRAMSQRFERAESSVKRFVPTSRH